MDGGAPDIAWLRPDGSQMTQDDWSSAPARAMAVFVNGHAISEPGPRGERIIDDSFLLLLNPDPEDVRMILPGPPLGEQWQPVLDTASPGGLSGGPVPAGVDRPVTAHSVAVLRRA